jgi:Fe-S-cluster containining protein
MPHRRTLPLYGGVDAGPRPDARDQVDSALRSGTDPMLVAERVAANVDAFYAEHAALDLPDEPKPACGRGCSHCCHTRVETTAPEVFLLARFLRAHPDAPRAERIVATAKTLEPLDGRGHHLAQIRCALLGDDGACTVYSARPIACRRAHSTDASVCAAVHRDPTLDVRISFAATLQSNTSSLVLGWLEGSAHAGRPPHHYELHAALVIALREDDAETRFVAGEDPLRVARTRAADDLPLVLGSARH